MRSRALLLIMMILPAIAALPAAANATEIRPWAAKVHPVVLDGAEEGAVEMIAFLDEQADLGEASGISGKSERGAWVARTLRSLAGRTQAPLIEMLEARGVEYRSLWIANMIWVRGDLETVEALALRPEVRRIDANPRVAVSLPEPEQVAAPEGSFVEWGIAKTGADQLWALGYRGQGVVIAGQDTGYEWNHPALRDTYRGWDGVGADHDYNWHDSIHSGGGSCGADSPFPCDDHNHGTHTMGTMVGDDGGFNQIGMAPDAKWIGCRNMNVGDGTPVSYSECFQWFVAPTDVAGQNPDPSKAPHIINNSWSCPESEGCEFDTLQTVVSNTRAAGILIVVSAGNEGSGCSTVANPPAIYADSLSVGATTSGDSIASFSSRGPVTVDGSNRLKPDLSGPGVAVRSSVRGGGYSTFNGTSMAAPHVAGLAALLLSARPDLEGRVEELETLLMLSSTPLTSGQTCGGFSGSEVPNAVFGHGRIDGLETLLGDVDGDGTVNLDDCSVLDDSVWGAPGPAATLLLGGGMETGFSWSAPADPGGSSVRYDLVRSPSNGDFSTASCVVSNASATSASDAAPPSGIFYYLIRAKSSCGSSLGQGSGAPERSAKSCLHLGG